MDPYRGQLGGERAGAGSQKPFWADGSTGPRLGGPQPLSAILNNAEERSSLVAASGIPEPINEDVHHYAGGGVGSSGYSHAAYNTGGGTSSSASNGGDCYPWGGTDASVYPPPQAGLGTATAEKAAAGGGSSHARAALATASLLQRPIPSPAQAASPLIVSIGGSVGPVASPVGGALPAHPVPLPSPPGRPIIGPAATLLRVNGRAGSGGGDDDAKGGGGDGSGSGNATETSHVRAFRSLLAPSLSPSPSPPAAPRRQIPSPGSLDLDESERQSGDAELRQAAGAGHRDESEAAAVAGRGRLERQETGDTDGDAFAAAADDAVAPWGGLAQAALLEAGAPPPLDEPPGADLATLRHCPAARQRAHQRSMLAVQDFLGAAVTAAAVTERPPGGGGGGASSPSSSAASPAPAPLSPFPLRLGRVTLHSVGRLQPSRGQGGPSGGRGGLAWHTRRALWPLGFRASRLESSPAHRRVLRLTMEVIDGKEAARRGVVALLAGDEGPVFVVSAEGLEDNAQMAFVDRDPHRPWLRMLGWMGVFSGTEVASLLEEELSRDSREAATAAAAAAAAAALGGTGGSAVVAAATAASGVGSDLEAEEDEDDPLGMDGCGADALTLALAAGGEAAAAVMEANFSAALAEAQAEGRMMELREPADEEEELLREAVGDLVIHRQELRYKMQHNEAVLEELGEPLPLESDTVAAQIQLQRQRLRECLPVAVRQGFLTLPVVKLLEGASGAPSLERYVFLEHRWEERLSGRSAVSLQQLVEQDAALDPDLPAKEKAWAEQTNPRDAQQRKKEKEERRRENQLERERAARDRHAAKAVERQGQQGHEKPHRRLETREKRSMARSLRKVIEVEVARRRNVARLAVQAVAEAEEARGTSGAAANATLADGSGAAAASGPGAAGAVAADEEGQGVARLAAAAVAPARGVALSLQLPALKSLRFSPDEVGSLLQLWDFLHTFKEPLRLARVPNLRELAQSLLDADKAVAAVSAVASAGAASVSSRHLGGKAAASNSATLSSPSLKPYRKPLRLLHDLAGSIAMLAVPSVAKLAGLSLDDSTTKSLCEDLGGLYTWQELSRMALLAHGLRDMGIEDKELAPLLLGAGVAPLLNNKPGQAGEEERRVHKLMLSRLRTRWAKRFPSLMHKRGGSVRYRRVGAMRLALASPASAPSLDRRDWRFFIECLRGLDPRSATDVPLVRLNIRRAVKRIEADLKAKAAPAAPSPKRQQPTAAAATSLASSAASTAPAAAAAMTALLAALRAALALCPSEEEENDAAASAAAAGSGSIGSASRCTIDATAAREAALQALDAAAAAVVGDAALSTAASAAGKAGAFEEGGLWCSDGAAAAAAAATAAAAQQEQQQQLQEGSRKRKLQLVEEDVETTAASGKGPAAVGSSSSAAADSSRNGHPAATATAEGSGSPSMHGREREAEGEGAATVAPGAAKRPRMEVEDEYSGAGGDGTAATEGNGRAATASPPAAAAAAATAAAAPSANGDGEDMMGAADAADADVEVEEEDEEEDWEESTDLELVQRLLSLDKVAAAAAAVVPEPLRRCEAVLRALAAHKAGPLFFFPVDSQKQPSYYDAVARPLALRDVYVVLRKAAEEAVRDGSSSAAGGHNSNRNGSSGSGGGTSSLGVGLGAGAGVAGAAAVRSEEEIDDIAKGAPRMQQQQKQRCMSRFVRDVRHIFLNVLCCSAPSSSVAVAARRLSSVAERLFLDWLVDPKAPPLARLDDRRCCSCLEEADGGFGGSADMVLRACDRCDAKWHPRCADIRTMAPNSDWFCPRCVHGRSVADVDPFIGAMLRPLPPRQRQPGGAAGDGGGDGDGYGGGGSGGGGGGVGVDVIDGVSFAAGTISGTATAVYRVRSALLGQQHGQGIVPPGGPATWPEELRAGGVTHWLLSEPDMRAGFEWRLPQQPVPASGDGASASAGAEHLMPPLTLDTDVPGYSGYAVASLEGSAAPAALLPTIDPAVAARAATLDRINPEFRRLLRALAVLGGGGEGESGGIGGIGGGGGDRGSGRDWLCVLSALAEVACCTSEAIQVKLQCMEAEAAELLRLVPPEEAARSTLLSVPDLLQMPLRRDNGEDELDNLSSGSDGGADEHVNDGGASSSSGSDVEGTDRGEDVAGGGGGGGDETSHPAASDAAAAAAAGRASLADEAEAKVRGSAVALKTKTAASIAGRNGSDEEEAELDIMGGCAGGETKGRDGAAAANASAGGSSSTPPAKLRDERAAAAAAILATPRGEMSASPAPSTTAGSVAGDKIGGASAGAGASASSKLAPARGRSRGGATSSRGRGSPLLSDASFDGDASPDHSSEEDEEDFGNGAADGGGNRTAARSLSRGASALQRERGTAVAWRVKKNERRAVREGQLYARIMYQMLRKELGDDTARELTALVTKPDEAVPNVNFPAGGGGGNLGEGEGGGDGSSEVGGTFPGGGGIGEREAWEAAIEEDENTPTCAFCGGTEQSLCSTMVQGQTWEEALQLQLGVSASAGDGSGDGATGGAAVGSTGASACKDLSGGDVEATAAAMRRRLLVAGLISDEEGVQDKRRLDPQLCVFVPVEPRLATEELRLAPTTRPAGGATASGAAGDGGGGSGSGRLSAGPQEGGQAAGGSASGSRPSTPLPPARFEGEEREANLEVVAPSPERSVSSSPQMLVGTSVAAGGGNGGRRGGFASSPADAAAMAAAATAAADSAAASAMPRPPPNVVVVRGSLVVHESCAEAMVAMRGGTQSRTLTRLRKELLEHASQSRVGTHTLPLGRDRHGAHYWHFATDPLRVYVQPPGTQDEDASASLPAPAATGPGACSGGVAAGSGSGGGPDKESGEEREGSEWLSYCGLQELALLCLQLSHAHPRERDLQRALVRACPGLHGALGTEAFVRELAERAVAAASESNANASGGGEAAVARGAEVARMEEEDACGSGGSGGSGGGGGGGGGGSGGVADKESMEDVADAAEADEADGAAIAAAAALPGRSFAVGDRVLVHGSGGKKGTAGGFAATVREGPRPRLAKGGSGDGGGSGSVDSSSGTEREYLVSYEGWPARFDGWIVESHIEVAAAAAEGAAAAASPAASSGEAPPASTSAANAAQKQPAEGSRLPAGAVPKYPSGLVAAESMDQPFRARGTQRVPPVFYDEDILADACTRAKAVLLSVEAALPVDALLKGGDYWSDEMAAPWVAAVETATTATELMEALLLLESCVHPRWLHSTFSRLYSLMPSRSYALQTASFASVACRGWVLDKCLRYERVPPPPPPRPVVAAVAAAPAPAPPLQRIKIPRAAMAAAASAMAAFPQGQEKGDAAAASELPGSRLGSAKTPAAAAAVAADDPQRGEPQPQRGKKRIVMGFKGESGVAAAGAAAGAGGQSERESGGAGVASGRNTPTGMDGGDASGGKPVRNRLRKGARPT